MNELEGGHGSPEVSLGVEAQAGAEEQGAPQPKPGSQRRRARTQFVRALPAIVTALVEKAKEGSVAHVKLLVEMEQEFLKPPSAEKKEKSLEEIFTEQWAKDEAQERERQGR